MPRLGDRALHLSVSARVFKLLAKKLDLCAGML
jgi:hypothetical protein